MQQTLKLISKEKQTPEKTQKDSPIKTMNSETDLRVNNFQSIVAGLVPDIELPKQGTEPAIMTPNSNKDGKMPSLQSLIEANLQPADVSHSGQNLVVLC